MSKFPTLYRLENLQRTIRDNASVVDGHCVPSRPMGMASIHNRVRCAYAVFTGKADAIIWPEDEWVQAASSARTSIARCAALEAFLKGGEGHE